MTHVSEIPTRDAYVACTLPAPNENDPYLRLADREKQELHSFFRLFSEQEIDLFLSELRRCNETITPMQRIIAIRNEQRRAVPPVIRRIVRQAMAEQTAERSVV